MKNPNNVGKLTRLTCKYNFKFATHPEVTQVNNGNKRKEL